MGVGGRWALEAEGFFSLRGRPHDIDWARVEWQSRRRRKESPPSPQKFRTCAELAAQSSSEQASSDDAPANLERVIGNAASGREFGSAEEEHVFFLQLSQGFDSNEKYKAFFFLRSPALSQ